MHNKNQPRPKLKRLFNSRLEDKKLTLISENELNDASWGAWFGQIQQALREKSWNGSAFNHCIVDMTPCKWADPLPLMSLSISLAEFEQTGGSVSLVFPPDNLNNDDHLRFLKFMAREGFISLFHQPIIVDLPSKTENRSIKNREVKIGDKEITHQLLDDLKEKNVAIAFERSTCLPVTLLYLECPNDSNHSKVFDDIDQWVERRFHEAIEPVVSAMVPGWAQRSIRYRLLTVLREMLHNVAEHAYDKSGNMSGFAAVYVRYREGALGEAPENWGRLQSFIKREHDQNKVPLMTPPSEHEFFPKTRTGFFELYVLDSGTGLCSSFNDHSEQISENSLHKYMLEIFDNGRRRKEKHSTKNGGLFLIRNLLEPMHDYLRIRDEDEWWGTELPLKRTEHGSTIKGQFTLSACGKEHTKNTIEGVAWTVRLSWLDKTDLVGFEGPWQGLIEDNDRIYRKALLRVLGADNDATLFSLEDIAIVDCRFPSQKWDNADKFSGKSAKIVLLLPQAGWTKNHIHHEIKESVITGIGLSLSVLKGQYFDIIWT